VPPGQGEQPVTPPAAAPDEGSGGLLRGPDLRRGQAPTLYENYGTAAYDLDSDYGLGDAGDKLKNFAASILWAGVVWVGDLSAKLLQWAFSIDVFEMAGDAVDQVVGALERTVYRPFLLSFLVLAGAYLLVDSWPSGHRPVLFAQASTSGQDQNLHRPRSMIGAGNPSSRLGQFSTALRDRPSRSAISWASTRSLAGVSAMTGQTR
jgi:hypothetical protein